MQKLVSVGAYASSDPCYALHRIMNDGANIFLNCAPCILQ